MEGSFLPCTAVSGQSIRQFSTDRQTDRQTDIQKRRLLYLSSWYIYMLSLPFPSLPNPPAFIIISSISAFFLPLLQHTPVGIFRVSQAKQASKQAGVCGIE